MTPNPRILIADMTKNKLSLSREDIDILSCSQVLSPSLFLPYDVIIFTAHIPSLSENLVSVKDFINGSGFNPLIGKNNDRLGPRFPDMSFVFSQPKSRNLPPVIITAGNISEPGMIRCDLLVWNAILAAHQKKKILGILYKNQKDVEAMLEDEIKSLLKDVQNKGRN